ncbi:Mannosylglycerate hydrolase [Anaerohalosphaera lusitana]|uniref:Mannosylglycerate hydrolase n=1 Tax=Anaerohalosphaera lusitana TaxID=1936003 RepID=A0A1U9NPP0_9BACT|nr:glycoside hydrolase family 38 C-terminal domain-containing protein [Anaerohalosphaera lusitana]AQT69805.1 Mannosylglycerate hydrolase [Anaerohalosphaera lusitana]
MEIISGKNKQAGRKKIKPYSHGLINKISKTQPLQQCHFISNTHWDREWRFSMQRTRHMLVYMMDMLLDIFEKEPQFKSFHLDSQTIPLRDYLEIRPEKEQTVRQLIKDKKLLVGPWFCLPDEFSVAGESLIRNLLLGHKIAGEMGHVSKTGYSPFGWGQISQMPQIYKSFGIEFAAFYRGVNTEQSPNSEYIWQGADGTRIVGSRLSMRPRYNVWYVIQRPAYWQQQDEDSRVVPWNSGNGPFKFVGDLYSQFDAQYARPKFGYDPASIPARAKQAMQEQDGDWTTPHRFWSCGHDSSCPDIREVRMIEDCNKALQGNAEVIHSTFEEFQKQVLENVNLDDLPVCKGEMRYYSDSKATSPLFGGVISARMDIKMDNFRTERELIRYAEPLAVYASMLGAEYPQQFLAHAYEWLLQNHGHDSIGGCSRAVVSEDMLFRTRQCREIAGCVSERALLDIAGTLDYAAHEDESIALLVYNPAPFKRDEVVSLNLEIPREAGSGSFEIVDVHGRKADVQVLGSSESFQVVQSPNDTANNFLTTQYRARAALKNIPPAGYTTFFVRPISAEDTVQPRPATMVTGTNTMENEYLRVAIQGNGTMTITDKRTGKVFERMGYFTDTAEVGDPWQHRDVEAKQDFTTINESAQITLIREGALETVYQIAIDWSLPACRTADDSARSRHFKTVHIENTITLRKGQSWVDIVTEVDNTVEDHHLQVAFPSGITADTTFAQSQFDVAERPVKITYSDNCLETPQAEQPMNSFIDISDGTHGLALLNEGMKAYEATDQTQPELRLTLLRCFPLRICVTQEMTDYSQIDKSSQCLGRHKFHYAVMPHQGDWEKADLWNAAEKFNLPLVIGQTAPTENGTEPLKKSFLEISDERIAVSAVKQSEQGSGWVVRLFNPSSAAIRTKIRLNGGMADFPSSPSPIERLKNEMALPGTGKQPWTRARTVNLEELPEKELALDEAGWCNLEIRPKEIKTLEFLVH